MAKIKKKKQENPEVLARIASNVKYLRKEVFKLKQEEMELHGFNYRFFQDIESGQHSPTLKTLIKLAAIFKVDVEDLLARELKKNTSVKLINEWPKKELIINFQGSLKILIGKDEHSIPVDFHIDQKIAFKKIINLIQTNNEYEIIFNDKKLTKNELETALRDYFKQRGFKI